MGLQVQFPNADMMKHYLSNCPALNSACSQNIELSKAIVELAVERFAGKQKTVIAIKTGTMLLINDMQTGKNGFTGKALPNFRQFTLPPLTWHKITEATEEALLECQQQN